MDTVQLQNENLLMTIPDGYKTDVRSGRPVAMGPSPTIVRAPSGGRLPGYRAAARPGLRGDG
jgi:hypothetical protein